MPTTSATALLTARSGTIVEGRILMRSAQYGRPHLGRCVQRHFHGFQGCVVDVLHTVDRLCSGRPRCSVDVFQTFGSLKPCSEIESYLEADFICVPGNIPLEFRGNYSATSNNMILAHWPLTGGLLHFIQRGGPGRGRSPPRPIIAVPNVTAHPSTTNVPITVLLYNGSLLCGFNVAVNGLICDLLLRQCYMAEYCDRSCCHSVVL